GQPVVLVDRVGVVEHAAQRAGHRGQSIYDRCMREVPADRWARWLLKRRDAGDERQRAVTLSYLAGVRDRVLAGSEPLDGAAVLDVGAGDGLIGLAALERVGAAGRVVFTDISPALLERCREAAGAGGHLGRARFVHARRGSGRRG